MSKIISVYKTTDGEVFTELTEATTHQKRIDIWEKIKEEFGVYGEVKLNYFSDFEDLIKYYEENK